MKRNTNNILMLAYITFIFVAVFTKRLYDTSKWHSIIAAITVTSWTIVLSDLVATMALLLQESIQATKGKMESLLFRIRHNLSVNNRLDVILVDEHGERTGKTMKETLSSMAMSAQRSLKTIEKQEKSSKAFEVAACVLLYVAFILFFSTLLFEPVYSFFGKKLDGLSALAFGTILAGQYLENIMRGRISKMGEELTTLNEGMELLNKSYEREAKSHAD